MSINLFIPAAGLGTRLRPLTENTPKPLLPICGVPLIQRIIEQISQELDIDQIGINTHYLPEVVNSWTETVPFKDKIKLFHEEEILGTGGALKNASELLSKKTFILANGDVLMDLDWQALIDCHRKSGNLVTLAVQDRKHERRVGASKDSKLICINKTCSDPRVDHWYGYACAAVYEPEFLDWLPNGESHVVPFWVDAAKQTGRVGVFDIGADNYWLDLGTPESFAQASIDILNGESRFFCEPLKISYDCNLSNTVIIESNIQIHTQVELNNVIILPNSVIPQGSKLSDCIVGPNFIKEITWPEQTSQRKALNKIGNGGSDRVYTRENGNVILHYSAFEENVQRQIELTKAFRKNNVAIPEVLDHQPLLRAVTLEDLGDITFRQWQETAPENSRKEMIGKILDELKKFQFIDTSECPVIKDKIFNMDVLLWETSYFLERFVMRVCGIEENFKDLKVEFIKLAEFVNDLPKAIMHRDFQSENVMIKDDKPWFIDFQGAHWGTPFYDLASFLKDPYTGYTHTFTKCFEEDYLSRLGSKFSMTDEECSKAYTFCGMQRHMQALGAYGFISKIRGKENFIRHAKPALEFLEVEVEIYREEFANLYNLVQKIRGAI